MSARRFSIIGAGAGGLAAAATLAEQGIPARIFGRSDRRFSELDAHGGLVKIEGGQRARTDVAHTTDMAEALDGAEAVIMMLPTSSIPWYATLMAPHLAEGARVLLAPGHTGGALAFRNALRRVGRDCADIVIGETSTLPFITRMTGPAEVTVWRRTRDLLLATLPNSERKSLAEAFKPVVQSVIPARNVLESSLSNMNAVMHPPGMVGNIGWIESTNGGFKFYSEGVTPGIGRIIDAIDQERRAIGAAYGLDLPPFLEVFERNGLVTHEIARHNDVYLAIHESGPNREIDAPATMRDRYVEEDIGAGLVALRAFAEAASVATPVIDAAITLASTANDVPYIDTGLNAAALGIDGMSPEQILDLVTNG